MVHKSQPLSVCMLWNERIHAQPQRYFLTGQAPSVNIQHTLQHNILLDVAEQESWLLACVGTVL